MPPCLKPKPAKCTQSCEFHISVSSKVLLEIDFGRHQDSGKPLMSFSTISRRWIYKWASALHNTFTLNNSHSRLYWSLPSSLLSFVLSIHNHSHIWSLTLCSFLSPLAVSYRQASVRHDVASLVTNPTRDPLCPTSCCLPHRGWGLSQSCKKNQSCRKKVGARLIPRWLSNSF